MKRYILILLIIVLIPLQTYSYAAESSFVLNDNLRQNISMTSNKDTKKTPAYSEYYYKNTIQQETKPEYEEKSLNFSLIPVQNPVVETQINESIIYQENQKYYDAINPTKQTSVNSYYPGLRGPNQLVIYTPAYGLRTGTNEFGTEAIIQNNMVIRLNGADSIIPKNGFVISGHGKAKEWIIKNVQIGSKVYIDSNSRTIKVLLTPDSLLFAAKEKIKEVSGLVEYYRQLDILYNDKKANSYLNSSKNAIRNAEKKPEKTQAYIKDAMNSLDDAIKNAIPYYKNELKGVWVRPTEKTPEQIEKTIERMYNAGITDIFLETYFHGKTIYPSQYLKNCGVIPQREEFIGFDPLSVWIKNAHKRNMKVHIWFESFYVGNDNPKNIPNHVLSVYPSWANKKLSNYESETPVPSLSEHNGYFLDPANPQVRLYLEGILDEIIDNYKIDGINLDYVRYPQTVDASYSNYVSTNWGYTQIAREDFYNRYGIDPINITYGTNEWDLWSFYRQNQISKFIKDIRKMTYGKNILLTTVVFPNLKKSKEMKMQNWKIWADNNYIDGITPLLLTGDKETATSMLKEVIANTNSYTKIYPGLFVTFMGGPFEDLLIQIHKTRELKTKGVIIFDYAHLDDKYTDALKTRVYNKYYESKEFNLKSPSETYRPQVIINRNETKQKKFRRRKNADN